MALKGRKKTILGQPCLRAGMLVNWPVRYGLPGSYYWITDKYSMKSKATLSM